jgi:hypothetical protein
MNKQSISYYFKYFTGVTVPVHLISDKLCKELSEIEKQLIKEYTYDGKVDYHDCYFSIHLSLSNHYKDCVHNGEFLVDHEQLNKERKEKIKDICATL